MVTSLLGSFLIGHMLLAGKLLPAEQPSSQLDSHISQKNPPCFLHTIDPLPMSITQPNSPKQNIQIIGDVSASCVVEILEIYVILQTNFNSIGLALSSRISGTEGQWISQMRYAICDMRMHSSGEEHSGVAIIGWLL